VFDGYTLVGFIAMISCTVGANLMLKLGAMDPVGARFLLGAFGWKSLLGLSLFGFAGVIYAIVLRAVPLNLAQVFAAVQFVGVILAARLVLNEPISLSRWLGIMLICFGVILVGLTVRGRY
jgi:multidrug transporter EmrE-like cation transporter